MADVLQSDELTNEPSDFGSLRPGTRLGRYELLLPIARGGMARVWAARQHGQRGFQKLVAIKTILPHLADETEFERMFLDEARIASGVHHPNVCEIYELGEENRTLYMAMEWVSGDSLSRVLRSSGRTEALDCRVVARIVADACAGVHAAHELTDEDGRHLNVVHRDMSPHNVLLSADGVAKVCDFGVAKALGQLHEQTTAGQLKGKLSYMSPEQVTGAAIDRRSDVFSLGCMLYEATTGVRPFRGERDHQIIHAILNGEVDPPTRIAPSYPPELERIVLRALAHRPALRYQTAELMRFALEEFLTRGQLVTQSNVAQLVRARIGEQLDRRKERIKQAQSVADQNGWDQANVAPTRDAQDQRSGVKPARQVATLQMPAVRDPNRPPATNEGKPNAAPATPRMTPVDGSPGRGSSVATGSAGPMLGDDDDTIHGHALPASSPTLPQVPAARALVEGTGPTPRPAAGTPPEPIRAASGEARHPIGVVGAEPQVRAASGEARHPIGVVGAEPPRAVTVRIAAVAVGGTSPTGQDPQTAPESPSTTHAPKELSAHQGSVPIAPAPPSSGPSGNPFGNTPVYDIAQAQPSLTHDIEGAAPLGAKQYAIAALVGLLFAVLISVGGFLIWQTRTTSVEPATTSTPPTMSAPSETTSAAPVPATSETAVAFADTEIVFRVTPADAKITLDGRELAADKRAVSRPAEGQTITVLVKAKGYEDTIVQVESSSPTPLEINMKRRPEIDASSTAREAAKTAPPSESSQPQPKPRPQDANALPENPE